MPKFNQNHLTRQTQPNQAGNTLSPSTTVAKGCGNAAGMSLTKSNQGAVAVRKIPPTPPKRRIFRAEPDGMPVIAEFYDKKNVPTLTTVASMAPVVTLQPTTVASSKPRVPPKPLITFLAGQQQQQQQRKQFHYHQQQNLLNQAQNNGGVIFKTPPPPQTSNVNLNNSTNLHHKLPLSPPQYQPPPQHHPQTIVHQPAAVTAAAVTPNHHNHHHHRPKQQLKLQSASYVPSMRAGEKSDPENHIYEMIDDYETNNNGNLQQVSSQRPAIVDGSDDEAKEQRVNMFQDLLRAEMMNQMQSCSRNLNSGGFLSHLTQEKRMDIIQETALSIATTTYHEKWVELQSAFFSFFIYLILSLILNKLRLTTC